MKIFQVDAFSDRVFKGNPAAVVPLQEWPDVTLMQAIAAENNLSETAFFVPENEGAYRIRWFTPATEVDLCGHATLASAHVLFNHLDYSGDQIVFYSNSGELTVRRKGGMYWMNFPSKPPEPVPVPKLLPDALGSIPLFTGVNTDLLVLFQDAQVIRDMNPDMSLLERMEVRGIIVTAPGKDVDFVSRFFAPSVGVPEDPVTGSAHTVLTPFWSKRLKKDSLDARQISRRGGVLTCVQKGDRVEIGGDAITYLVGDIEI